MNTDLFDISSVLNEEEQLVQDNVGRFVNDNVLPIILECFENHRFPPELIPDIAALGILGSSIKGYGCAGMNAISFGLICKELERGDSGLRSFASVQSSLVMFPIFEYGSDEQKNHWLPKLAKAEAIGCFGLTEPDAGSDVQSLKTEAVRDGEDYLIN